MTNNAGVTIQAFVYLLLALSIVNVVIICKMSVFIYERYVKFKAIKRKDSENRQSIRESIDCLRQDLHMLRESIENDSKRGES